MPYGRNLQIKGCSRRVCCNLECTTRITDVIKKNQTCITVLFYLKIVDEIFKLSLLYIFAKGRYKVEPEPYKRVHKENFMRDSMSCNFAF